MTSTLLDSSKLYVVLDYSSCSLVFHNLSKFLLTDSRSVPPNTDIGVDGPSDSVPLSELGSSTSNGTRSDHRQVTRYSSLPSLSHRPVVFDLSTGDSVTSISTCPRQVDDTVPPPSPPSPSRVDPVTRVSVVVQSVRVTRLVPVTGPTPDPVGLRVREGFR